MKALKYAMMTLELTPVSLRGLQVCVLYAVVSLSLSTCNKVRDRGPGWGCVAAFL